MTPPTAEGITLTRPSILKDAGQLFGGLFEPLGKLLAAGTLGGPGEALVALVASFRPEETTQEAAWRLVWLALRDAVEDLADDVRFPSTTARDSIDTEHLLQHGGGRVDLDRIEVPRGFLKRPSDLPVLEVISGNLEGALVHLGVEADTARAVAQLLPERFEHFFHKQAMQQRERLDQLRDLLQSEPAMALFQRQSWQAYRARLQLDLHAPLFGGPFSLRRLYQPLRGYWTKRREGEHGRLREQHHVVDLAEAFDGWLARFDKDDALRVVAGGPGSGKSSFVKWWATQVMQREPMLPTLLVPCHHLDTFNIVEEVGKCAKDYGFPVNPLDVEGGQRRLLLILDGLDELDADHLRGRDAAAALVTAVDRLLSRRNAAGSELRVVLAGRDLIVESLQGVLKREGQIFHVLGYAPRGTREDWDDPDERLKNDQRQDWWVRWGDLSGEALAGLPAEIAGNKKLADLSDQPLLNHLLAITRADDPAALRASSSANSIYASLLRNVFERSWGDKRQIADLRPLRQEHFNRVFESIGLAVWQHGGGRATTLDAVAEVAQGEKLDDVLPVFKEGAKEGALALLTAFFFGWAGSNQTFELRHKTFGEYLAARRLARLVEELHENLSSGAWDESDGLRRWYRLTWAARITLEILKFLENEVGVLPLEEVRARRATLIRLFNENLASGMPHQGVDGIGQPKTYREAERFTAAAELALFATIGVYSRVVIGKTEGLEPAARRSAVGWSPDWPDRDQVPRTSALDLLRRLEAGTGGDLCARGYMQGIDLDHQLLRLSLARAKWGYASARSSNLGGADLRGADLRGADLRGANLRGANLDDADLGDADLRDADLRDAYFCFTNLGRAHLLGADLRGAEMGCVNVSGAKGLTLRQLKAARNFDFRGITPDMLDP